MKTNEPILEYESRNFLKPSNSNGRDQPNWEELCHQLQEEKNFFKDQYQKLYQSYCDKKEKIKQYKQYKKYIRELEEKIRLLEYQVKDSKSAGNNFPKDFDYAPVKQLNLEVAQLKKQNQKLTGKLILKNQQLEETYTQLQSSVGANAKVGNSDALECHVMESVNKHFQGLKRQSVHYFGGILGRVNPFQMTQQFHNNPQGMQFQPSPQFVQQQYPAHRVLAHHNASPPKLNVLPPFPERQTHSPIQPVQALPQTDLQLGPNLANSSQNPQPALISPDQAVQYYPIPQIRPKQ